MTVYVDDARHRHGRMLLGHMLADSLDELHRMADALGLRRAHYQPVSFPHYDISLQFRRRAVDLGAMQTDRRGIVAVKRRLAADAGFREEVSRTHGQEGLPMPRFMSNIRVMGEEE